MTKTEIRYYCDVCRKEVTNIKAFTTIQVPVFIYYDDTEFKPCSPYMGYKDLDLCSKCLTDIVRLHSRVPEKYELK